MTSAAEKPSRTRLAVFGSVAAARPAEEPVAPASLALDAVLGAVYDSITSSAPEIAAPIVDRAVDEGRITRRERRRLLRELQGQADGAAAQVESLDARRVLREALAAIRREAPVIAAPILDDAVEHERLTPAQRRRILDRLRVGGAGPRRTATPAAPRSAP